MLNFTSYLKCQFLLLSLDFNAQRLLNMSFTRGNLEVPKTPHPLQQGFGKSLHYNSITILEASKPGNIDSSETILDVTKIMCNIFG